MDFLPSLQVELNFRLQELSDTRPIYRVKHDSELPGGVRDIVLQKGKALPEVFPLLPSHYTKLTRSWQQLWKDLNPTMTGLEWRRLLQCHRAFTNDRGFDCGQGHGPFADYINGRDIGAELPKIECLVCGGALLSGIETVYKGVPCLSVDALDGRAGASVPRAEDVPVWQRFEAVSVSSDGSTQSFSLTPYPEVVPLVASIFPVYFPLAGLEKLDMATFVEVA